MLHAAFVAAAALAAAPAPVKTTVIVAEMATTCGRAADYQDEQTARNVRRLVKEAKARGDTVEIMVIGGGTLIGVVNPGAPFPIIRKAC